MTMPATPDDWIDFLARPAGSPEPPRFGELPPGLRVPVGCPGCGRGDAWRLLQVLGETPGIPGAPAAAGGVRMRCNRCALEAEYRAPAPDAAERARRTTVLWEGTKR